MARKKPCSTTGTVQEGGRKGKAFRFGPVESEKLLLSVLATPPYRQPKNERNSAWDAIAAEVNEHTSGQRLTGVAARKKADDFYRRRADGLDDRDMQMGPISGEDMQKVGALMDRLYEVRQAVEAERAAGNLKKQKQLEEQAQAGARARDKAMNRLARRTIKDAESSDTIDNEAGKDTDDIEYSNSVDDTSASGAFRDIGSSFANTYQRSTEMRFDMQQEVLGHIADTSKEQLLVAKETLAVLQDIRESSALLAAEGKENLPTTRLQHSEGVNSSSSSATTRPQRVRLNVKHPQVAPAPLSAPGI